MGFTFFLSSKVHFRMFPFWWDPSFTIWFFLNDLNQIIDSVQSIDLFIIPKNIEEFFQLRYDHTQIIIGKMQLLSQILITEIPIFQWKACPAVDDLQRAVSY